MAPAPRECCQGHCLTRTLRAQDPGSLLCLFRAASHAHLLGFAGGTPALSAALSHLLPCRHSKASEWNEIVSLPPPRPGGSFLLLAPCVQCSGRKARRTRQQSPLYTPLSQPHTTRCNKASSPQ